MDETIRNNVAALRIGVLDCGPFSKGLSLVHTDSFERTLNSVPPDAVKKPLNIHSTEKSILSVIVKSFNVRTVFKMINELVELMKLFDLPFDLVTPFTPLITGRKDWLSVFQIGMLEILEHVDYRS